MTRHLHESITKVEGFNYVEGALPFDRFLREELALFKSIRIDWVHSALQDGCLNVEMHLLLTAVDDGYERMEAFCKLDWQHPRAMRKHFKGAHRIFSEYRANAEGVHDKLRATASECLSVYALFRQFAHEQIADNDALKPNIESFNALCCVIDIIQQAKKRLLPMRRAAKMLRKALSKWLALHKSTYGDMFIKPKFHWMFDIADHFETDLMVIDQLIIERMHLEIKWHAERVDNLRMFEGSVLAGVLNQQVANLRSMAGDCCLLHTTRATIPGCDATLSESMRVLGMHMSIQDLVFHDGRVGRIIACAEEGGTFQVIVKTFRLESRLADHSSRWRASGELRVWLALEVEQVFFFVVGSLGYRINPCSQEFQCACAMVRTHT